MSGTNKQRAIVLHQDKLIEIEKVAHSNFHVTYYVPGTVSSTWYILSYVIFTITHEQGIINIHILKMSLIMPK